MSNKIRLLVTDGASGRFLARVKANAASEPFEIIAPDSADVDALLALAPEAEAILCYKAALPASVIRKAAKLRYIQKHGLNCKNIDVSAAHERGVTVGTQSLMRNATVAEQALTLMLCCERKAIPGQRAVEAGVYREMGLEPVATSQWNIRPNWPEIEGVAELFGKSAGIIGLGDIGMDIAKRCLAFDMEIFYYQRTRHTPDVEAEYRATYLEFNDLLERVDYLVLVLPHTDESEGMIGAAQLARMKKTATLINVGRGALVDEAALVESPPSSPSREAKPSPWLSMGSTSTATSPCPPTRPRSSGLPGQRRSKEELLPHTGGGSNRQWDVDIPKSLGRIAAFFGEGEGRKP